MANQYGQKLRLLYVLDILKKETDENHIITASEIAEKIKSKGIACERKTVYSDISALEEFGYDIIKSTSPKGYFLGSREFEEPEVFLLADAVKTARFITPEKTRQLTEKLNSFLGIGGPNGIEKNVFVSEKTKCDNGEIYYTIDKINRAIKEKKKVDFNYSTRKLTDDRRIEKTVKRRIISPYALVWHDDGYYVLGNYEKYDNVIHLRIDRITELEITDEPSRSFTEVTDYKEYFNVSDYVEKLFGMHSGQTATVELRCDKSIFEQVVDRFTEDIFIKNVTDKSFGISVQAAVSEGFITWVMNYGDKIKVESPDFLIEKIKSRAENILKIYL